jgi:hypothetical protein
MKRKIEETLNRLLAKCWPSKRIKREWQHELGIRLAGISDLEELVLSYLQAFDIPTFENLYHDLKLEYSHMCVSYNMRQITDLLIKKSPEVREWSLNAHNDIPGYYMEHTTQNCLRPACFYSCTCSKPLFWVGQQRNRVQQRIAARKRRKN